jgi:MSHA biogenesis protein MshQ
MKLLFAWVLCLAGLLIGPIAHAQTYVADSSAATQAAYPWIDISTTGTTEPMTDDDVSGVIPLGFTFTYGATAYTSAVISSNGMLFFTPGTAGQTTQYRNSALPLNGGSTGEPNIDAVMLPLWDDLQPNNVASYVRYRTQGTAPNRVFIVSWLSVPYYCSGGSKCNGANQTTTMSATFQVQIYEQGQFVYRYGTVDGSGGTHTTGATQSNAAGATVGYELTNSDYVQFSFHTASVPSNTTILWSRPVTAPGGFNAFDTTTASGAITGNIHTKVAGSAFNLSVVALNTAKTAVATTFTGDVKVELLDASDNSGAINASTGCRSTWTTSLANTTTTFATADAGRDTVAFNVANSYRDVRVRMSYPATGTATVVACSTDDFANRPSSFAAPSITDADWSTTGTAAGRTLSNATATGGNVHKAGQPFTIRTSAMNAAGTPATTTNYTGTPTAIVSACSGTACTSTFGALTVSLAATAGVINNTTASYSEVGAFSLQLVDSSFASVDGADGSTAAETNIASSVVTVGRFVPDHFDVQVLVTPVLRTFNNAACATRSFTYVGQPFGYTTAPQATVLAHNAAGGTTVNYAAAMWKLVGTTGVVTQAYSPLTPTSPGLDLSGASLPSLASNNNGTGVLAASSADLLKFVRSTTTPLAPFNAAISLAWSVSDTSESSVTGNGTITTTTPLNFSSIAFDSGNNFRFGVLKLASAYGSELNNLPVAVEAQYWDGTRFATNAADQCTSLPTGIVAMSNYQRNLAACETGLAAATLKLSSGRGFFTLLKPGAGNSGSVDLGLQLGSTGTGTTCVGSTATAATLGNLPWLQGKWGTATTYDKDPTARASFGQYKSPLIYLRESF